MQKFVCVFSAGELQQSRVEHVQQLVHDSRLAHTSADNIVTPKAELEIDFARPVRSVGNSVQALFPFLKQLAL